MVSIFLTGSLKMMFLWFLSYSLGMEKVNISYGFVFIGEDTITHFLTNVADRLKTFSEIGVLPAGVTSINVNILSQIIWSYATPAGFEDLVFKEFTVENEQVLVVSHKDLTWVSEPGSFLPVGLPGLGDSGWGVLEIFGSLFGLELTPTWWFYGTEEI